MQTPVNNMQPYLVLNEVIATTGIYPSRDGVGGTLSGVIGQIHTFASSYFSSASVQDTDGELVTIATNTALFSLLGTYYGGDGKSTFGLPNLDGRSSRLSQPPRCGPQSRRRPWSPRGGSTHSGPHTQLRSYGWADAMGWG